MGVHPWAFVQALCFGKLGSIAHCEGVPIVRLDRIKLGKKIIPSSGAVRLYDTTVAAMRKFRHCNSIAFLGNYPVDVPNLVAHIVLSEFESCYFKNLSPCQIVLVTGNLFRQNS